MSDIKNVLAVASGKGGVGKSTVSVNLALSLKEQGYQVGLLDADIYGPSVPSMLNTEGKRPTTPDNKTFNPILASGIELMSIGYIVLKDEATIWRGPMMSKAIEQLLFNTNWSDLDYLIIDLPPGTGDAQLTLSKKAELTAAVLVTTPQKVALLDVKKSLEAFMSRDADVVRQMSIDLESEDDAVDELYSTVRSDLMELVKSGPENAERATYLMWAAHNVERVADRAMNIVERARYQATGEMISGKTQIETENS